MSNDSPSRPSASGAATPLRPDAISEAHLRLMIESIQDYAILMLDPQGHVVSWNSGAQRIIGYTEQEILGRHCSVFYAPEDIAAGAPERDLRVASESGRHETEVVRLRKGGTRYWASVSVTPLRDEQGRIEGYAKITRDITERKRAEDRFRLTVEAAPNAMLMVSADGRIALVNSQTEKLFGYPRQELLGLPIEQLVPERYRSKHPGQRGGFFSKPVARSMGVGRDLYGLTRDGREVPIEIGLNPIETGDGLFVLASIIDITERKRAEDRFRLTVEAAPNAMLMISPDGRIALVNSQTEKLFGYPRQELLGLPIEQLVPERYRSKHPGQRGGFFSKPVARSMGVGRDLYGLTRDGREVPIEIGLNPIETGDGLFVLASIIDITERKRSEKALWQANRSLEVQVEETQGALKRLRETQVQLIQSEKLASLGGLVAGVAHEINTPVGVGVTAASHLHEEVKAFAAAVEGGVVGRTRFSQFLETCRQSSDILLTNLNRAAQLIHSFKQVAVDQSNEEWRKVNLHDYLQEILLSLRPRLRKAGHRIELDCAADIRILTVPGALSQIVTNLMMNTLTHAYDEAQIGTIRIAARTVGERLELRYSDDGKGIPEDVQPKIFDPFFTTKRGQGGSGLGLHIVYNLVHSTLGGQLAVSSVVGQGTTFILDIPLHPPATEAKTGVTP